MVREDGGLQTVSVALTGEFDQELSFSVTAGTDDSNLAATATGDFLNSKDLKRWGAEGLRVGPVTVELFQLLEMLEHPKPYS